MLSTNFVRKPYDPSAILWCSKLNGCLQADDAGATWRPSDGRTDGRTTGYHNESTTTWH